MNLKEIFDKAEGGVLSYEAFQSACKASGIKLADLSAGDYVAKKKFEDELASKDSQITTLNDTIAKRDIDLNDLRAKLTEAGTDAQKLSQLSTDLTSLQGKYDADVKSYKEQLRKQAYEFAVKDFASTKKFTSNAAKRDFINSMIAKELKMDGDRILGAEDFVGSYSTDNADAFVVEAPVDDFSQSKPLPKFVETTPGNDSTNDTGFQFNFTGVRSHY